MVLWCFPNYWLIRFFLIPYRKIMKKHNILINCNLRKSPILQCIFAPRGLMSYLRLSYALTLVLISSVETLRALCIYSVYGPICVQGSESFYTWTFFFMWPIKMDVWMITFQVILLFCHYYYGAVCRKKYWFCIFIWCRSSALIFF